MLPKSIHLIAEALGVTPSEILEDLSVEEIEFKKLIEESNDIVMQDPEVDRENVLHTLILLREKPVDRLRKGLIRAQKINIHR